MRLMKTNELLEPPTAAEPTERPGYKLTKLGWLPETWEVVALESLTDPNRNITYGIVQAGPHVPDGVPFIKTGDLTGNLNPDLLSKTSLEIARLYERSEIRSGDLLFSLRGNLGTVRLTPLTLGRANISRGVARISPVDSDDRAFLRHVLSSPDVVQRLNQNSSGSTFQEVTLNALRAFEVPYPSRQERIRIGDVLNNVDQALTIQIELITAKATYKSGLMQQLLTGRRQFAEFEGQAWQPTCIGSFATESRLPGSNGKTAKKLTVKLYGRGVTAKSDRVDGSANTKYYTRRAGQLIYSKLDFLNGAFGLIPSALDGYESTLDLPTFDLSDEVDPTFILAYFRREEFYSRFADIAAGGRKAVRIAPEELLQKKIDLPSFDEQRRIAAVLTACDRELDLLRAQLAQLQGQKKGLMQVLLTGQVRVIE